MIASTCMGLLFASERSGKGPYDMGVRSPAVSAFFLMKFGPEPVSRTDVVRRSRLGLSQRSA